MAMRFAYVAGARLGIFHKNCRSPIKMWRSQKFQQSLPDLSTLYSPLLLAADVIPAKVFEPRQSDTTQVSSTKQLHYHGDGLRDDGRDREAR